MTLKQLIKDYQDSVDRFNEVLQKGDGALSMYDLMMGYDAEFYLTGNCPLIVNHVIISKRRLLEFYESCGFAYAEQIKRLKEIKEIPDEIIIPEFDYSTLFNKNIGASVPEIVSPDDIIICSYSRHSIYEVKQITGPYHYYGNNEKMLTPDHFSIICTQEKSNQPSYLNNLVAVNGKIMPLLKSNDDEYFHINRQDYLNNPKIINGYYEPWNKTDASSDIKETPVQKKKEPVHKPKEIVLEQLSFF